jgi:streptogramin lyase
MKWPAGFGMLAIFLLGNVVPAIAQNTAVPGVLYAVTAEQNGSYSRLLTINPETGAMTDLGEIRFENLSGLTINAEGGLFAMSGTARAIKQIDAITAHARTVAYTNFRDVQALAFNEDHLLYVATTDALYTFDFENESWNWVSSLYVPVLGMAFDPTDGTLWACTGRLPGNTHSDEILTIDPVNGMVTPVGVTGLAGETTTIAFNAEGNLFGMKDDGVNPGVLISIDKATGAGTVIDSTGISAISGMAFRPPQLSGPQLGLSTPAVDFGRVPVDSAAGPKTLVLRNLGTENLTITGINGVKAPFGLENLPSFPVSLAPGDTLAFRVLFQPPAMMRFSGILTVSSDDAETARRQIMLRGEGFVPGKARRGVCYATAGYESTKPGSLLRIDPTTGRAFRIGPSGLGSLAGLAINTQGIIIATDGTWGDLFYLDAGTGAATFIAHTGLGGHIGLQAIAFDDNDVLYGVTGRPQLIGFGGVFFLYRIDVKTGTATQVATLGSSSVPGMSFDPIDGILWASITYNLLKIDPATGKTIQRFDIGLNGNLIDLHFDAKGQMFGLLNIGSDRESNLISIDKSTGTGTVIGNTGFNDLRGIAFHPLRQAGAHIAVNVQALDFGPMLVDSMSVPLLAAIASIGDEDLTVTGVSTSDAAFQLSGLPALPLALKPGERFAFSVRFAPAIAGEVTAKLSMNSNDTNTPVKEISLSGDGLDPAVAEPGFFYAATGRFDANPASLVKIDPDAGSGALIGASGLYGIRALAIDKNGVIFGTVEQPGELYVFDIANRAATSWRQIPLNRLDALAIHDNNVLYGIIETELVTIDIISGEVAFVANTGRYFDDLAFDPVDGRLWGVDGNALFLLDHTTGEYRLVGKPVLRSPRSVVAGIHFGATGKLVAIDGAGGNVSEDVFIALKKTNLEVSEIGLTGFQHITSLAGRPQSLTGRKLAVSHRAIDFGPVPVDNTSPEEIVTLRNIGSENVTVTAIDLSSQSFQVRNLPALPLTLSSGATASFAIDFRPGAPGAVADTLILQSDDIEEPEKILALAGEGMGLALPAFGQIYAVGSDQNLISIDASTGAGTQIATIALRKIQSLAINSQGVMYAIEENSSKIYIIDASTGAKTFVGRPGVLGLDVVTFGANDVLYGEYGGALYTIDPKTAKATFIGPTDIVTDAMTFDHINGILWGVAGTSVFTIDPVTGKGSLFAELEFGGRFTAIVFDGDGNLFAVIRPSGPSKSLFASVDKLTGSFTIIGEVGFFSVRGLAVRPEPRTGRQLGVSALALDLGKVLLNSVRTGKLSLYSIGTETVAINDITISPTESSFTLKRLPSLPLTLSPGAATTLDVLFAPQQMDTLSATIVVASDDVDDDTLRIALAGRGLTLRPATPGIAYALSLDRTASEYNLLRIDVESGQATRIGVTDVLGAKGLAVDANGLLHTIDRSTNIHRLDAMSGSGIPWLKTDIPRLIDLTFDKNDALYGTAEAILYSIDTKAGNSRSVAFTEGFETLAFDPTEDQLWGATFKEIYKVDPSTGVATLVGETGLSERIIAMDFDHQGRLFAVVERSFESEVKLVSIDKSSGSATVIGDTGFRFVGALAFAHVDATTGIPESASGIPERFVLTQNYPNPFNPETRIEYVLPVAAEVHLEIFNLLGQRVRVLVNQKQPAGVHRMIWDGTDDSGRRISSGVYVYRLRAGAFVQSRKLLVLR